MHFSLAPRRDVRALEANARADSAPTPFVERRSILKRAAGIDRRAVNLAERVLRQVHRMPSSLSRCRLALPFSQPSFLAGVQELRSVRRTVKGSVNNFVHCRDYNMDGWRDNYWRPFESNCFLH